MNIYAAPAFDNSFLPDKSLCSIMDMMSESLHLMVWAKEVIHIILSRKGIVIAFILNNHFRNYINTGLG